jgi:hypothetical protein
MWGAFVRGAVYVIPSLFAGVLVAGLIAVMLPLMEAGGMTGMAAYPKTMFEAMTRENLVLLFTFVIGIMVLARAVVEARLGG